MPGDKQRAPTLYGIITLKLVKGAFFTILGLVAYSYSDNNLSEEYRSLLHFLHVNPERQFWVYLAEKVSNLTESNLLLVAATTCMYGTLALIEGIGLWLRGSWASWLAIGESAIFIPIEIYELQHKYRHGVLIILILNIIIFWYLLLNRKRLFHTVHLRRPHPPAAPAVPPIKDAAKPN